MNSKLDFTEHKLSFKRNAQFSREHGILLDIIDNYANLDPLKIEDSCTHMIAVFLEEVDGEPFFHGYLNAILEKIEEKLMIKFNCTIGDKSYDINYIQYDFFNFFNNINDEKEILEIKNKIKEAIEKFKIYGKENLK